MRYWFFMLCLCLPLLVYGAPAEVVRPTKADWPVWPVIPTDNPLTGALASTGENLHWDAAVPTGATRLFLSNHPETITRFIPEGKLWVEEGKVGDEAVIYRLFFQHYNHVPAPIYLAVILENLADQGEVTLSGEATATRGVDYGDPERAVWAAMKRVGERNAYAELSGKLRTPLTPVTAVPKGGERVVIYWKLAPGDLLGGRMWLTVRRTAGTAPVAFRLSTVWAKSEQGLTGGLPLIPAGEHHPRGTWPVSAVALRNSATPFDLGPDEDHGRTVRAIRLCQPVYENGVKVRYTDEVIFTRTRSANSAQALANNGMYGAVVQISLCVKNSGATPARVGIYLRYPVKDLEGVYVGAATAYAFDEKAGAWKPAATKAVDLSNLTYGPVGENKDYDRWWTTAALGTYPVQPGETREIPLTLTTDGPAMLPLAIVLRKETAK